MRKIVTLILCLIVGNHVFAQEKGIIDNSKSPNVKFRSVNFGDCQWTEGFWADKWKVCEETMVPYMGEVLCGDVGHALNNFKIVAGMKEGEHGGHNWHDGDFYKYMEACMYIYAQNKDKEILKSLDEYISIIGKAQHEDGYLQTSVDIKGQKRFGNRQYHEMYNSGHLMTSACIHYRITGQTNFMDIAKKNADFLYDTFMPKPKELARFGFNQTQIMGLVEMYRTLGDKKYLDLAELFINMRGTQKVEPSKVASYKHLGDMVQERKPIRKENEAVGHAVLALYFYAGAADVVAETGEKELKDALDRLWSNVVNQKMYVTGACGQTHHGVSSRVDMVHEAFINDYMMPNLTAYNETCANICNSMFSYRMLGLDGDAKYSDVMELVLYNSALSGINIQGNKYFYANPLRSLASRKMAKTHIVQHRKPYLECFCCPPNIVRTIAKVSGWAYSLTNNGVAVNLYGGNKLNTQMLDGSKLSLTQVTKYPWEGKVDITLEKCKKDAFEVQVRIPEWAKGSKLLVNGTDAGVAATPGTYAKIDRKWKKGDVITIDMPMDVKYLEGHERIEEVRNQVAVKRGPVVYCAESTDLPSNAKILDLYLPSSTKMDATYKPDFLGGVTTVEGNLKIRQDKNQEMYNEMQKPTWETAKVQLIPYFAWSNRGKSEMSVWIPVMWE
ncbi:glycoside hydrolase family 127 protein [Saccharicrinis aurantiacus]|uniref:glycoside hydrolase family 127 protein n=1 Tax=Saccharicrinis aurantiacus TaxID=1849719 RepID=UPI00094F6081|nr:beta-L-arabinofuranosidase domain-containing protein [Saccharicrinis aurantiacus]